MRGWSPLTAPASLGTLWIRGEGTRGRLEKINLSNNLRENGAEPRAGSAAVGGAKLAFPAMHGDSVTTDSQGADSSSLSVSAGSSRFLGALKKS